MNELVKTNPLAALDFDVKRYRLWYDHDDPHSPAMQANRDVLINGTTGQEISTVSPKYQLIQHRETLLPAYEKMLSQGWQLAERESGRNSVRVESNGRRAYIEMIHPEVKVDFGVKQNGRTDLLSPRMLLGNGYDAMTSLRAEGGAFQWVCLNGLKRPTAAMIKHIASRHIGRLTGDSIDGLLNLAERYLGEFETVAQGYRILIDHVPTEQQALLAIQSVSERHENKIRDHIERPLGSATGWEVFSGITNYLTFDFKGSEALLGQKQKKAMELILA